MLIKQYIVPHLLYIYSFLTVLLNSFWTLFQVVVLMTEIPVTKLFFNALLKDVHLRWTTVWIASPVDWLTVMLKKGFAFELIVSQSKSLPDPINLHLLLTVPCVFACWVTEQIQESELDLKAPSNYYTDHYF